MRVAVIGYITPDTKAASAAGADSRLALRRRRAGDSRRARRGAGGAARPHRSPRARRTPPAIRWRASGELVDLAGSSVGAAWTSSSAGMDIRPVDTRVAGMPVVAPEGGSSLAVPIWSRPPPAGEASAREWNRWTTGRPTCGHPARRRDRETRALDRQLERHVVAQAQAAAYAAGIAACARRADRRGAAQRGARRRRPGPERSDPRGPPGRSRDLCPAGGGRARGLRPAAGSRSAGASSPRAAGAGRSWGPPALRCTSPGRRCATIRRRKPGQRVKSVDAAGRPQGRRAQERYTLATDDSTARRRAEASRRSSILPAQRAGMLDVEAVAAYLRRLPQPVEVGCRGNASSQPG